MSKQADFYTVKKDDTLWKIARDHGTTVSELQKINGIKNTDRISVGQRIALRREAVCGVGTLFLDRDRNPIKGIKYRLESCGKHYAGTTSDNGKARTVVTATPEDLVNIWVQRLDGTWKKIATVVSGYGNKSVTLVSAHMVIEAKTERHPMLRPGELVDPKARAKSAYTPTERPIPTLNKKELGPMAERSTTNDGKPLIKVTGDIPRLDEFLDDYVGGNVTRADIEAAAKELRCEAGPLYAIAQQESSSSSFIKIGDRTVPKILYERHQFRNRTRPNKNSPSPYEQIYPDICGPAYARARKNKQGEWADIKSGMILAEDNVYGPSGVFQYKRLVKAYQLDSLAALQACSWGKFQLMGSNYRVAGFDDVKSFTKAMGRSDAEHVKAFLQFAKSNEILLDGLRTRDFVKIAKGHNGKNWRAINPEYASNIEKFYKEYDTEIRRN